MGRVNNLSLIHILFGLEYDSRLMAGRDILSDEPGLVIFSNYSFLTEEGAYNSVLDEFRSWDGSPPDEAYVQSQIAEVQNLSLIHIW